jgi:hypothetical protein
MNDSQINELSKFLEGITEVLDLTPRQNKEAKARYQGVGEWLDADDSSLKEFEPEIFPQGSFRMGTMIKPLTDAENYDIDLVCKLNNVPGQITQRQLKEMVGDRLKANGTYAKLLNPKEGGKRCWTLEYAEGTRFHMDVLPAVPDPNRRVIFSAFQEEYVYKHALRITCTENEWYDTSTDLSLWNKSNPVGYAEWFKNIMSPVGTGKSTRMTVAASVEEVEDSENKTPLQRAIQVFKRHRDIMFQNDQDNKPISIIITTLAARAYDNDESIFETVIKLLDRMPGFIETNQGRDWIGNPVNREENFADKWEHNPVLKRNFMAWIAKAKEDFETLSVGKGIHVLKDELSLIFGDKVVYSVFHNTAAFSGMLADQNTLKFDNESGYVGSDGTNIPKKDFHGQG